MLYKVGDKVTVRKDLAYTNQYRDEYRYFNLGNKICNGFGIDHGEEMATYAGNVATIISISDTESYRIDLDYGEWSWLDTMFEETLRNNKYKAICKESGIDPKEGRTT